MSTLETPMILRYWEQVGGTLIEEYPVVRACSTCERRRVDAIIFPKHQHQQLDPQNWRGVSLQGQEVIVVQAKSHRLGMVLMGQAVFSPRLVERHKPKSVRSVLLCGADDSELRPLLEKEHLPRVEVIVDDTARSTKEPQLNRPDEDKILDYWHTTRGTLILDYPLIDGSETSAPYAVPAIILPKGQFRQLQGERVSLEGEDVIVLHSRKGRVGMAIMGRALFSAQLTMERYKPKSVRSIALCDASDSVLGPLLAPFPHVEVLPNHY
jgi:hypothetical protein